MNVQSDTTENRTIDNRDPYRLARIRGLRDHGIDPYPAEAFGVSASLDEVRDKADRLIDNQKELRVAGRIIGLRPHGGSCFLDLFENGARLQVLISRHEVGPEQWAIMKYVDAFDFLGAEGPLFKTQAGETTLRARRFRLLGKATIAPPIGKRSSVDEVHQALRDTGRLRQHRHLEMLSNPAFIRRVRQRALIVREIRAYLQEEGFVEVETPVLSTAYGGAAATPFTTTGKALGEDLYLRVSPECYLKRLLCGGLSKVFELGKNFRNEGIDRSHNPEFTALEWYEAHTDYLDQMRRFETLVSRLAKKVTGSTSVIFRGKTLEFTPPWPRIRVLDAVAQAIDAEPTQLSEDSLRAAWRAKQIGGEEPQAWGELVMGLFEELIEATLWGPVFVIDHPVDVSPLTKQHRSDCRLVERFEPFAGGMEIGNAYSELNDPVEQRRRLEEQDLAREEAYGLDEAFICAIEDGMPQAGGVGMGIDRIVMLLTDTDRFADVILFPTG